MNRKKPIRFPDAKLYAKSFEKIYIFKNNRYFGSLAQFEIFEQIWGTVKDSSKRFENAKCFPFDLSTNYYM